MKKRIGIDMRMAGEGFGIGKYVTELVRALLKRGSEFEYVLFFDRNFSAGEYEKFIRLTPNCRLISCRYYSLEEQLKLPGRLAKERLDLVHFPNFNAPIFYAGKTVITIHDLIHHRYPGKKKKNFIYRFGYRAVIKLAAMKADGIIAVSNSSRNDIINLLGILPEKVDVVYNGLSPNFSPLPEAEKLEAVKAKFGITKPYLLWVGVWRKYKNLSVLSRAFEILQKRAGSRYQLVLAGERDKNYPEIGRDIDAGGFQKDILAPGKIAEADLRSLYRGAFCYVSPSLLEGFNLPALEAQACGAPVVSSDIPVAREIFADSAIYFTPSDPASLADKIEELSNNPGLRKKITDSGLHNASNFTWDKAAEKTESVYRQILTK